MSGNGNFWTGLAFGALTGFAAGAAVLASSHRCCHGHYGYGGFYNSCFLGNNFGCRTGWGPNSVIYGLDVFTPLYASPLVHSRVNLGYFI